VVTASDILARLRLARVAVEVRANGRIETRGRVPDELKPLIRQHRDEIEVELRGHAEETAPAPTPTADVAAKLTAADTAEEAAGELRAVAREANLLQHVSAGLGPEIDGALWRVLDRLLDARDMAMADRVWRQVKDGLRRGILSRLVGWLRSLDRAGIDLVRVRRLIETGPGLHPYHDAR